LKHQERLSFNYGILRKITDNIVQQIIVVSDTIDDGATWCNQTFGGQGLNAMTVQVGWTHSNGVVHSTTTIPIVDS
jgi:hypothetical protein